MRFFHRSPIPSHMPRKCFISHSYRDAEARDKLIQQLPREVEAVVFPPIDAPPEHLVSNSLITAILDCDGLIYLEGGHSARSFWVAFECDYARRAGKTIYSYNPAQGVVRRDTSPVHKLPVFPSYSRQDDDLVQRIVHFMKDERFIDLPTQDMEMSGDIHKILDTSVVKPLQEGGYVVLFWSQNAESSPWVKAEWTAGATEFPYRVLIARMDDTPLSVELDAIDARINGRLSMQLYGDQEQSELHRMDNLVVRLYWLINQNSSQNHLD